MCNIHINLNSHIQPQMAFGKKSLLGWIVMETFFHSEMI